VLLIRHKNHHTIQPERWSTKTLAEIIKNYGQK